VIASQSRFFAIAMALTLPLTSLPLSAQAEEDRWYLTPSLGYYDADGDRAADDGSGVGIAFGKAVSEHTNIELAIDGNDFELDPGVGEIELRSLGINALYLFDREGAQPFLLGGIGAIQTTLPGGSDETYPMLKLGLGVLGQISDNGTALRIEAGYRGVFDDESVAGQDQFDDWYAALGLQVPLGEPTPVDSDGDGVNDPEDACPATPAGRTVDSRGCERDSDGDGVLDSADECPGTANGVPVDARGCEPDSDGDGVLDSADICPGTGRGIQVGSDGCELDSDGDGVIDGSDACPGTPGGRDVDLRGCERDSDGDGVVDGADACANSLPGAKVDARGCATANQSIVLKGVNFASGSDQLTGNSRTVLDRAAATLRNNPLLRVEIGGHTDSVGAAAYNQQLSQKRASAVRNFLVQNGAKADRLTARGYGELQPIADNGSADGRAANRRVEMKILK